MWVRESTVQRRAPNSKIKGARELIRKPRPLAVNNVALLAPLRSVQFSSVQLWYGMVDVYDGYLAAEGYSSILIFKVQFSWYGVVGTGFSIFSVVSWGNQMERVMLLERAAQGLWYGLAYIHGAAEPTKTIRKGSPSCF